MHSLAGPVTALPLLLHLTVCSSCAGVTVHTRRILLPVWPYTASPFQLNLTVCSYIVNQCTRTPLPHLPPWPGHSFPSQLNRQNVIAVTAFLKPLEHSSCPNLNPILEGAGS